MQRRFHGQVGSMAGEVSKGQTAARTFARVVVAALRARLAVAYGIVVDACVARIARRTLYATAHELVARSAPFESVR